jgi:hypothetical protein
MNLTLKISGKIVRIKAELTVVSGFYGAESRKYSF